MCSLINKQLLLTAYAYLFIMEQQKAQGGSEALQVESAGNQKQNKAKLQQQQQQKGDLERKAPSDLYPPTCELSPWKFEGKSSEFERVKGWHGKHVEIIFASEKDPKFGTLGGVLGQHVYLEGVPGSTELESGDVITCVEEAFQKVASLNRTVLRTSDPGVLAKAAKELKKQHAPVLIDGLLELGRLTAQWHDFNDNKPVPFPADVQKSANLVEQIRWLQVCIELTTKFLGFSSNIQEALQQQWADAKDNNDRQTVIEAMVRVTVDKIFKDFSGNTRKRNDAVEREARILRERKQNLGSLFKDFVAKAEMERLRTFCNKDDAFPNFETDEDVELKALYALDKQELEELKQEAGKLGVEHVGALPEHKLKQAIELLAAAQGEEC